MYNTILPLSKTKLVLVLCCLKLEPMCLQLTLWKQTVLMMPFSYRNLEKKKDQIGSKIMFTTFKGLTVKHRFYGYIHEFLNQMVIYWCRLIDGCCLLQHSPCSSPFMVHPAAFNILRNQTAPYFDMVSKCGTLVQIYFQPQDCYY